MKLGKGKKKYNLVCLFDVLYHKYISSDEKVLSKVFKILKRGGNLCITDCAMPLLWSWHDNKVMARERYYLKDLEIKLQKVGFIIEKKSYIFFSLFPLFIINRMLGKFFQFSTIPRLPPLFNNIFISIYKLEAFFLRYVSFPIGSSLIILAKKP